MFILEIYVIFLKFSVSTTNMYECYLYFLKFIWKNVNMENILPQGIIQRVGVESVSLDSLYDAENTHHKNNF